METEKNLNEIKKWLKNHEERLSKLEEGSFQSKPSLERKKIVGVTELVKKTGVNEEKIRELFDFEKDSLTVLEPSSKLGKNYKERTKNIALLVVLGYKYFFGKDEIFSQEIKRNVEENGIPTNNFATYLNEITPSFIRRKGKIKSPKTAYRMTVLGESTGKELIKQLCER